MDVKQKLLAAGANDLLTRFIARVGGKKQVVATRDAHGNINLTKAGEKFLGEEEKEVETAVKKPSSRRSANPAAGDFSAGLES